MAKGDMKQRLMQGQQPGLPPVPLTGGATNISAQPNMQNAVNPSPEMQRHIMGVPVLPPDGITPEMPQQIQGNARMMPMQSGTKLADGKHPIGTNKQRMLKYNSPTGY